MLNSLNINNLNSSEVSIIELNSHFYCLNDGKTILLLQSINIEYKNIGLLKISDNFITVFILKDYNLFLQNYNISMGGN